MSRNRFWLGILLGSLTLASSLQASPPQNNTTPSAANVKGTWSGTFLSQHENVEPFTVTVVIEPDAKGKLMGSAQINSDCLRSTTLHVTVEGSNISLAGSDEAGATVTFYGTIDRTGTMLDLRYVVNGSHSGRCESDDGTGNMGRR